MKRGAIWPNNYVVLSVENAMSRLCIEPAEFGSLSIFNNLTTLLTALCVTRLLSHVFNMIDDRQDDRSRPKSTVGLVGIESECLEQCKNHRIPQLALVHINGF